jgi:DNA-binding CsgD family transcriptional regulator
VALAFEVLVIVITAKPIRSQGNPGTGTGGIRGPTGGGTGDSGRIYPMTAAAHLVGRDAERLAIDRLLATAAAMGSGSLLLSGEPGIGKSALLEYAAARADRLRLLATEGVEPEADLPFAGLHRLLRPVLDRLPALPEAQAAALRAGLGLGTGTGNRFLVGAGVLSLLAEVAGDSGVLCLVDDAHWLDRESADALTFAARRLDTEGVAILFAARDEAVRPFPAAGIAHLRLEGLPGEVANRLVLAHAAGALAPAVLERVVELSGGNPLALLELPAALSAAQRAGVDRLPEQLPLSERIRQVLLDRVAGLPEPVRLLLLIAAAEPNGDLAVLARAADQLGGRLQDLDAAERVGMVTVGPSGVQFRSALLRSAIYSAAPYLRRRAIHEALAEALSGSQPDRWAWHRATVAEGFDPVLADELERSANRARVRAGHAAAAVALERAAELTVDEGQRIRRLVAAAAAAWEAGQRDWAEQLLRQAEALDPPARQRAEITFVRGSIETRVGRPGQAVAALRAAAAEIAEDDPARAVEMLTSAMEAASFSGDFSLAPQLADLATTLAARGLRVPVDGLLAGVARLVQGDPAGAAPPLRAFIDHARGYDDPRRLTWGGAAAAFLGDDAVAREFYDRAVARARQAGALGVLPSVLEVRALLELVSGQVALAEADATESMRLADELREARPPLMALAVLAGLAAFRAQEDKCVSLAERAEAEAARFGVGLPAAVAAVARAELDLSLGRLDHALDRLRRVAGPGGTVHPVVPIMTTPSRIEILVRTGQPVPPTELEWFTAWAAQSPSPAFPPLVARCRALLAEPSAAAGLYEQALRLHAAADRPYERARTELLFAEYLRRQRRPGEARTHLRGAVEVFDRLGAVAWAERARAELRATGEAMAPPEADAFDQLTPQELQIVRLVSEGLSNRQAAAQLFLSPRTVEYHLYKVYPKLGISSRGDLIRQYASVRGGHP